MASQLQTRLFCESLAETVSGNHLDLGQFLGPLFEALIAKLIGCLQPDDGASAQQIATDAYDPSKYRKTGGYKPSVFQQIKRRTKRAAVKQGHRITGSQAEDYGVKFLNKVRTADPQQLSLIIREHEGTPAGDDEDDDDFGED